MGNFVNFSHHQCQKISASRSPCKCCDPCLKWYFANLQIQRIHQWTTTEAQKSVTFKVLTKLKFCIAWCANFCTLNPWGTFWGLIEAFKIASSVRQNFHRFNVETPFGAMESLRNSQTFTRCRGSGSLLCVGITTQRCKTNCCAFNFFCTCLPKLRTTFFSQSDVDSVPMTQASRQ